MAVAAAPRAAVAAAPRAVIAAALALVVVAAAPLAAVGAPVAGGWPHRDQAGAGGPQAAAQVATVRRIVDGDTLDVRVGGTTVRVRLLQIDTPEVHSGRECWGREASAALARLLPSGTTVTMYADPALDRTDRYGRALRYVFRGTTNVNVRLVAQGDAAPYFYDGERGRYAAGLERVAVAARRARLGLWGACPGVVYDPSRALNTGPPTR
jgi:micrococcal nuclease